MKEMSYRDKMVILVISIIIILVAGFFALIRPTYNKLVNDTATYEATKTEWDGIKQKLDAIPSLKEGITSAYNTAKNDAAIFENEAFGDINTEYDTKKLSYNYDQYLQQAIDDNGLELTSFTMPGVASKEITFYYYEPTVVTYALLESGDINGKYAKEITDLLQDTVLLKEKKAATLLASDISIVARGTRENLMTFLDTIKEDENAVIVNSVSIADYTFSDGAEKQVTDAEGNVTTVKDPNAEGKSDLTIELSLYNAKTIDKPDLGE
jgi:hypothetical protein